ncbi:reverse transcriptase [Lithospermum erythrorhizon]|uniref:Reverse transcriptase n=1 Tax=Lithospermum erythrorhizon TaxID=34254 RepID=A0AAV3QVS6_LITER
MFADDMFIMSSIDEVSLQCIKSVLKEFGELAGLVPNMEKSNIFVARGNVEVAKNLSRFMNIPIGILSLRYLGVPLTANKMSRNNCKVLVDKITERLQGRKVKLLSYVGKVQLICSMLQGITQYWASIILVLKSVWDDINALMSAFLWSKEEGQRYKANIKWQDVYRPNKKDTILVKWVNIVSLKGKSIWAYTKASKDSWVWKFIWKHREWLYQFVENKMWRWRIYKTLVEPGRKKRCAKVVWFRHNVPRHSFILWLLVLGRVETRDRVVKSKNGCELKCLFCDENESRNHVFFQCDFSGNLQKMLLKVTTVAIVYWLWRE